MMKLLYRIDYAFDYVLADAIHEAGERLWSERLWGERRCRHGENPSVTTEVVKVG